MLRTLIPALLLLSTLVACVSVSNTEEQTQSQVPMLKLSAELQALGVAPRFVKFLAQESVDAGVKGFKVLPRIRNLGRDPNEARLYAITQRSGIIYLDTQTTVGRSPFIILHEIAHVPHYGGACNGHHTAWASEFAQNAARFEAQFPKARWLGRTPSAMALQLKTQYGIGSRCP
jgi:hypothetical protein